MSGNPGRPRDSAQTRSRIMEEARRQFAAAGFAGTTVRAVAAGADVSPNLITRYFGGKQGLFVAAADVDLHVALFFDGPRETLGRRMADGIVNRWTTLPGEDPLLALHRAAGERPDAAAALSTFLDNESLEPVRRQLLGYGFSEAAADTRARAIDALVLGVSTRYRVLRHDLGDAEAIRAWLAEAIQRLLAE